MLIVWIYLEDLFLLFIMKRTSKLFNVLWWGGGEGRALAFK